MEKQKNVNVSDLSLNFNLREPKGNKCTNVYAVLKCTPLKCAKPTVSFEDGKLVFRCETNGVEFVSQILDDNVTAYSTSSIPLKPKYIVRVIARIKGSEDSDVTTAEFEWHNDNPQIKYIK